MKAFPKFAAVVLALLLVATPLFGAAPCISGSQAAPACGQCCHDTSAMGMMAGMGAAFQTPAAGLSCCSGLTFQSPGAAITAESQGKASSTAAQSVGVRFAAADSFEVARNEHPRSDPPWRQRIYSVLCTLLI